jgi:dihydrodipicolinate synthase/N-acetylneuraminate lyase
MVSAGITGVPSILFALSEPGERLDRGAMRAQVDRALEHDTEGIVILGLATQLGKRAPRERLDATDRAAQDMKDLRSR